MADEDKYRALLGLPVGSDFDYGKYLSRIIQSVHSVGYPHIAERLEQETDIASSHQPLKFANLRSQFLGGFWEKCAETLLTVVGLTEKQLNDALFIIFRQYLEERLALDYSFCASKVLGNEYIHHLSPENYFALNKMAHNFQMPDGLNLHALFHPLIFRRYSMEKLNDCLPEGFQLNDWHINSPQIYSCLCHNTKDMISLSYKDHSCYDDHLPTKKLVTLNSCYDERILCMKFSHNGQYLASASADHKAFIWEVPSGWKWRRRYVLRGHTRPVTCVSWSPNDELLVTCASGENLRIWDVRTGKCTSVISERVPVLRSCDFLLSDQIGLVYGTSESIRLLRNGCDSEISRFETGFTVNDFVVTPNGRKIIYKDEKATFTIVDVGTGNIESLEETEEAFVRGFCVSEDSESLLLSLSNGEIHVWDLKRLKDKPLTYWGHNYATCITRPCFGGVDSRFLACGTSDGKVWIWNRRNARPIDVFGDSQLAVRCISWNPGRPQMLASAGDDCSIIIWGPKKFR